MLLRHEQPGDIVGVRYVNEQAFGRDAEADLVDALRASGALTISWVAVEGDRVVGHVAFSPVLVDSGTRTSSALGLGPMSVLPEMQRQGVGSQIIRAGLEECLRRGHERVVVLGHAEYYPRFGFVPASRYGVRCEYDVPEEVFMAVELREGAWTGHGGLAKYAPEFKEV